MGRRVDVGVRFQQAADAGEEVGADWVVKVAAFGMVSKRRSHVACGFADSAAKYCRRVRESKRSVGTPLEIPNAGEKSMCD